MLLSVQDKFYDLLQNHFGETFAVCVLIVAVILTGGVFLTIWLYRVFNLKKDVEKLPCADHTKKLEKVIGIEAKLKELPCVNHDTKINSHDTLISESKTLMGEIKGKVDTILQIATTARTKPLLIAETDYSQKHSPRMLNKNGETLYSDINGEKFLADNIEYFMSEIDKLTPKTALDVENFALAVLRASLNDDIFIPLKNWVYNAPAREIERDGENVTTEVSMDDVLFILSIPLRDKYLSLHTEIGDTSPA